MANDNRTPAGTLTNGVLSLRLEARQVHWQPEGPDGITLTVPAFAEDGKPPAVPGPLVRVPSGTRIAVHLRNAFASETLTIHGMHDRPGHTDQTAALKPGEARDISFAAGPPGTFFYWATTSGAATTEDRKGDGMLTGAIIVDPPGAAAVPDERVFIVGDWNDDDQASQTPNALAHASYVFNGRAWPATERLEYPVGKPIHWRLVNASTEDHPLHLHGTYMAIESNGDESTMTPVAPGQEQRVVTQVLGTGKTMTVTWTPGEPGTWLFHCHILFHVDSLIRLTPSAPADGHDGHGDHESGEHHMAGLVLAVNVTPASDRAVAPEPDNPRRLTLEVGKRDGVKFPNPVTPKSFWPGLGYRWIEGQEASSSAPFVSPGTPLVLNRGEPVAISVVNRLEQTTTVHWHGIELESYYDGVSGIGGSSGHVTPPIAPGKTFVVRFTPPRAGTFMYHTHLNDFQQLTTGLYGAIVVKEPGDRFDPDLDRVYVFGQGPDDVHDPVLVNGHEWPDEQAMRKGATYRLRFAAITSAVPVTVSIRAGDELESWKPLAKDGMPMPAGGAAVPASCTLSPGETFDVSFTPAGVGPLRFVAAMPRQHTELTLNVK